MKIEDYEAYDLLSKHLPSICRLQTSTFNDETSIIIAIRKRDRLMHHDTYLDFFNWTKHSELVFLINENIKEMCTDFLLLSTMPEVLEYFNRG